MNDPILETAGLELAPTPDASVTEPVPVQAPYDNRPLAYPGERRLSPSKYRSVELSPAWEGDKTLPEHPVTARGKLMHKALETGDDSGLEMEEVLLVESCRRVTEQVIPERASIYNEFRFPITGSDYGFADRVAIWGSKAALIDYKFAFNKQEDAETNPQVQAYAVGIFGTFPYVNTVDVYLLYPRLDVVDMATFTRKDMPRLVARIMAIKRRHDKATPETCNYHESTCTWCRHLATCSTAAKALLPVAVRYADTHAMPFPQIDFAAITDPDQWSRLMKAAPVFEAVADSIKRHARAFRLETGQEVPGFDLITMEGKRTITAPAIAHEIATRDFGLTQEDFLRAVSVSASDLLNVVREKAPRGQKGKRAQELEDALRDAGALTVGSEFHQLRKTRTS